MSVFVADSLDTWLHTPRIIDAAHELQDRLQHSHPEAFALARADPLGSLEHIHGLTVIIDNSARHPTCPIDGTYDAANAVIRYRDTTTIGRINFTLLHELGHHLLAHHDDYQYDVVLMLGDRARHVEERIVNAFASTILIPKTLAEEAFTHGVTAAAARHMYLASEASASAALARCLLEPGDRAVLLTDLTGHLYFAQSNGEPFAPRAGVQQPTIAQLAARLHEGGTLRAPGGDGIHYASGNTNHRINWDLARQDQLIFAIATPATIDNRLRDTSDRFTLTCTAQCGATFTPAESPGTCPTCREPRCPRCQGCDCRTNTTAYCTRCTLQLPTARARAGHSVCEECE